MKKIVIASILVIGLAAGLAYGHGNRWGGHMGGAGYGGYMMGSGYGGHMMGPGYGGHMMGQGMMGGYGGAYDCPAASQFGQDRWDSAEHQRFLEDTVGLRKDLNDKRFAYGEALRDPDTSRDQLAALEKEIFDIEKQIQEKAEQY